MICTVLFASPRGEASNTRALLTPVLHILQQAGYTVREFSLYDMEIRPCQACRGCQTDHTRPGCVLDDDMSPVFDSILQSDLVLLAAPVYVWSCPAPMKAALDRLVYAMNKFYGKTRGPALWAGKRLAAITSCGYRPERGADLWEESLRRFCKHSQLIWSGLYAERHLSYDIPFMDAEKQTRAEDFARTLLVQ